MMSFFKGLVCDQDGKPSCTDFMSLCLFSYALGLATYGIYTGEDWKHFEFVFQNSLYLSVGLKGYKYGLNSYSNRKKESEENGNDRQGGQETIN